MSPFLQPFTPPSASLGSACSGIRLISFRHPAYPDYAPELLRLTAVDGENRDGIDYQTALIACCIVTGNTWSVGWLATKDAKGGFTKVDRPDDGILRGAKYYFHLGDHGTSFKYPVIPSFDHWRFPHGDVPSPWSNLAIPPSTLASTAKQRMAAMNRDGTCRISGYFYATEIAHLVPVSAAGWFKSNCMNAYCRVPWDPQAINDECNMVVLRRDLHHLFDNRRITFIAKRLDNSETANLVTHALLEQGSTELVNLYQNRLTQPLTGISAELLFARFAWTIFSDEIFPFLSGMHTYNVRIFDPETGQYFDEQLQRPAILGKLQLFDKLRSRSVSPSKRTNDQISQDDPGDEAGCLEDINYMSEAYDDDSEPRGRRRKRSYDWHESPGFLSSASSASHSAHDLHETSTQVSSATEAGSVEHHYDQEELGCVQKRRHIERGTTTPLGYEIET